MIRHGHEIKPYPPAHTRNVAWRLLSIRPITVDVHVSLLGLADEQIAFDRVKAKIHGRFSPFARDLFDE